MHHYEDIAAMFMPCNGQDGGKMDPYHSIPSGYLRVDVGKSCVLLLTREEYAEGLRRGKTWRRRQRWGVKAKWRIR